MNRSFQRTRRVLAALLVLALPSACRGPYSGTDLPFVPFEASDDLVPALPGELDRDSGFLIEFDAPGCDAQRVASSASNWHADLSDTSAAKFVSAETDWRRQVEFDTMRWVERRSFDRAKHELVEALQLPCFSTEFNPQVLTEPIDLDGLPDGAIAVRWFGDAHGISAILFDADSQVMMVVTWLEDGGDDQAIPIDDFVNSANQAWSEFLAANPPVE